jgi:hypothetical protein
MKITVSLPTLAQVTGPGGHPLVITADGRRLETPPVEHLTYYLALGTFAATEIIEWPVALALASGHFLSRLTHRPALSELGEGLEAA